MPRKFARDNEHCNQLAMTRRAALGVLASAATAFALAPDIAQAEEPTFYGTEPIANSWRYVDGVPIDDSEQTESEGISSYSAVPAWEKDDSGVWYNDEGNPIEGALFRGIDVSEWQEKIDWDKVKASGLVDYAIIRAAAFEGKTDQREGVDYCWERNASECDRLGIPYGAYIYSYATSAAEAVKEADYILSLIKGHSLACPIYIDIEDNSVAASGADLNAVAEAFCARIESSGHRAGIYSALSWWNTYLTSPSLGKWSRWIAQYNSTCDYEGSFDMWQATSTAHVDGIEGNVDINFDFVGLTVVRTLRLYNPYSGEHLYTTSAHEYDQLGKIGWRQEGEAWLTPGTSETPVYRLYNPYSGDHHYTKDAREYADLASIGWRQEGVAWYSDDGQGTAVWRLFNPHETVGTHHYTTDKGEYDALAKIGWKQEDIAWYGLPR